MPTAEILTIGTEILLGEIDDTNARTIALSLRDAGVDLFRKTSVGDNAGRIAEEIRAAMGRSHILITTGGLGPTVDDPTREAVALAFAVPTEFHPELWEQIQSRFRRYGRAPTENNRRQAYLPQGAQAIENPVGTAPAFYFEIAGEPLRTVIALPGVPREMAYLLTHAVIPYLRTRFDLHELIRARVLHTSGAGESQIDSLIDDLERLTNPTVGLAAHSGQVDVRITAKADSPAACDALIAPIEAILRERLGRWIYGADADTLEGAVLNALQAHGWTVAVVEAGLGGELIRRLAAAGETFKGGQVLGSDTPPAALTDLTDAYRQSVAADVGLGVLLRPAGERQEVYLVVVTPSTSQEIQRPYGGPPENAPLWALNHSLDILRNL
jgi:competence/damage-inducible protein CinA-like protein